MKITKILGLALVAATAATAAHAAGDPLVCHVKDGQFTMNDADFEAVKASLKKVDGKTWTTTKEEAKEAFLTNPTYSQETSTVRASVCQTRMLGHMIVTNQPRAATAADISTKGPYKDYRLAYLADSELDGFNRLLGWAGIDAPDSPFKNA